MPPAGAQRPHPTPGAQLGVDTCSLRKPPRIEASDRHVALFQYLDHAVGCDVPLGRKDKHRHQSLFQSSELGGSSPSVLEVVFAVGGPLIGSSIQWTPVKVDRLLLPSS